MASTERGHTSQVRVPVIIATVALAWLVMAPAPGTAGHPGATSASSLEDIRINEPAEFTTERLLQEALTCDIQSETTLARFGGRLVAAWVDTGECQKAIERFLMSRLPSAAGAGRGPDFSITGYGWSDDGGEIWHDVGTLRPPEGWSLRGDPVLAVDEEGTFYLASMARDGTGRSTIAVARSTDMGETFSLPVDAAPTRPADALLDRPWVAVDTTDSPFRGTLYVGYTQFSGATRSECPGTKDPLLLTRSTDRGLTFDPPVIVQCARPQPHAVQVAVGPDGEVYLTWVEDVRFYFAVSVDGGRSLSVPPTFIGQAGNNPGHNQQACLSWDSAVVVEGMISTFLSTFTLPNRLGGRVLDGDIRVGAWPSMAVDTFGSSDPEAEDYNPYRGRIYIAMTVRQDVEEGQKDEADIAFIRSSDGGRTWSDVSASNIVNRIFDDAATVSDQFFPRVAVNPDSTVAVAWYDRRLSTLDPVGEALGMKANSVIDVFAALSTDGGETFTDDDPLRVTDRSFLPAQTNPNTGMASGCYMGDYEAITPGAPGEFLLTWGDNRDVNPTTGLPDPNVYFDRILYDNSS